MSFPPRCITPLPVEPTIRDATARGVAHPTLLRPKPQTGPLILRVGFLGGTADLHLKVLAYAQPWSDSAYLEFVPSSTSSAQIRVSFTPKLGNWSYIGQDSMHSSLLPDQPSMNLANLDSATVLHEFGHALGLDHEHQHPDTSITLNDQRVFDDMMRPPNSWSREQVKRNILDRFTRTAVETTPFDCLSVMIYQFPTAWLVAGSPIPANARLSSGDIALVQRLYGARP